MAAFNKFRQYVEDLAHKVHKQNTDQFKVMLTNVAPVNTNAIKTDITDIGAGNGYPAGGSNATTSSSAQTAGTYKLTLADLVFTAAGGSVGPFRYAVQYNDTPTSPAKPLVGYWDYGSSITLADGETFTVDFDGTNGMMQLV